MGWIVGQHVELFRFTDAQRSELSGILHRRQPERINAYLNTIEPLVQTLRTDIEIDTNYPDESPIESREVLNELKNRSIELVAVLDRLDSCEAGMVVRVLLPDIGCPPDLIDQVRDRLPYLAATAAGASAIVPDAQIGRPEDARDKAFTAELARYYVAFFERRPSYSRGTEFPKFIGRVLDIAQPGNPHSGSDNSKFVESALIAAGILNRKD